MLECKQNSLQQSPKEQVHIFTSHIGHIKLDYYPGPFIRPSRPAQDTWQIKDVIINTGSCCSLWLQNGNEMMLTPSLNILTSTLVCSSPPAPPDLRNYDVCFGSRSRNSYFSVEVEVKVTVTTVNCIFSCSFDE